MDGIHVQLCVRLLVRLYQFKDTAVSLFTLNCKEQVTSLSSNSQYIMSSFELTERTHEYVLFQASSQTQLGQQFCKKKQTKVVTQLA